MLVRLASLLFFFSLAINSLNGQTISTIFETSGAKETPTYEEGIKWWQDLDKLSPRVKMMTMGPTDAGFPLHLVVISNDQDFNFTSLEKKKRIKILVNNSIHSGEPDGVDASMLLARDIVTGKKKLPDNVVLAIIPFYNIGGALNRSLYYRADQNGPNAYGSRGNARNFDLNRDFIKADSRNTRSFAEIFHMVDPDIFIDNHVSNGADYQHVMTLIASQHNKLGGEMGAYMNKVFEPAIYRIMADKGYDLIPYVNIFGATPDAGWSEFLDGPRYSSGYATLFNTFAFVPETHMLKPYDQRVDATLKLMESFIEFGAENGETIKKLRTAAKEATKTKNSFPLKWVHDKSFVTEITFKGYEATYKPSLISGQPRLYYDRSKPFVKQIPYFNKFNESKFVEKPLAYIIPQGWWTVIERLKDNKIEMRQFQSDTTITVEVYHIEEFTASTRVVEGHHPNSNVKIRKSISPMRFRKGDYFIPMNQTGNRFLVEVLEPEGEDSYFYWNFFDPILTQKEGFSTYVFEETALEYLQKNPDLKKQLEEKRKTDTAFAKDGRANLEFIYKNSPYYEPDYMRYPVYRVLF
ncbi:MAG TPA: M14 family metallopeptidase [Parasegetibacter sp.]